MKIPFFGEVIPREGVQPDPKNLHVLTEMYPNKNELQIFSGIMNYQGMYSPLTAKLCEPLKKLTLET